MAAIMRLPLLAAFASLPVWAADPALATLLPERLDGAPRVNAPFETPAGHEARSYIDKASGRSINVNVTRTSGASRDFAKAQVAPSRGKRPGNQVFTVRGLEGVRVSTAKKSEALLLLANGVFVTVSVQPAKTPDDAVKALEALDLAGLGAVGASPPRGLPALLGHPGKQPQDTLGSAGLGAEPLDQPLVKARDAGAR